MVWRPFSPLGALFENVITIWTSTFIWLSFAAKRPGRGVRFIQGFILRWVCTRPWSLHIDPQWGSGTVRLVPSNHLLRLFGLFIIQTAHWWSGCRFRSVNRYYDIKISEYICNMCTSGTRNGTTFTTLSLSLSLQIKICFAKNSTKRFRKFINLAVFNVILTTTRFSRKLFLKTRKSIIGRSYYF